MVAQKSAQKTEDEISSKKEKGFRSISNFLPWRKDRRNSPLATGTPPDQGNFHGNAAKTSDGDIDAKSQKSVPPDEKTSARLPPERSRDLWREASGKLDDEKRKLLKKPWNPPRDNMQSRLETSEGEASIKGRDKSAGREQKGVSTVDKSDFKHWVEEVKLGVQFQKEQHQGQWGSKYEEMAKKVLTSVMTVNQVIDAGLKFDPTGYGACAWTVVSFGLTLAQNDSERREHAFSATESLSELLKRYTKIEHHYRRVNFTRDGVEELEDAIIQAYVAILEYSAEVKEAVFGSAINRITKSLIALSEEPLVKLKNIIKEKDEIVKDWQQYVDKKDEEDFQIEMKERLQDIDSQATKTVKELEHIKDTTAEIRKYIKVLSDDHVLEGLSPSKNSSNAKHQNLQGAIERNRGENQEPHRFIRKEQYEHWKHYPQSVLWLWAPYILLVELHANKYRFVLEAGRGKSALCYSIIEDLAQLCRSKDPPQKHLVYWYFQSGKSDTKDRMSVIRWFLRQLCDARSPEHKSLKDVQKWLSDIHNRNPPPTEKTFLAKIKEVIKGLRLDIFIVLDGLDEVPQERSMRKDILDLVYKLLEDSNGNLHVLLVSTFEDDIQEYLQRDGLKDAVAEMDVKDVLNDELDAFIDMTLKMEEDFSVLDDQIKEDIRDKLKFGEEKSFLWATALLEDLRKCDRDEEKIQAQLNKVPKTMAERYDQALDSVKEEHQRDTRRILMWLLRHKRSGGTLTQQEVAVGACLSSANKVEKLQIRPIMMSTEGDGQRSRFIEFEYSAKEHLEDVLLKANTGCNDTAAPATTSRWFTFSNGEANLDMATRCLQVLLVKETKAKSKNSALKSYAAQYWHEHYLEVRKALPDANIKKNVDELDNLIQKLFTRGSAAFTSWLDCYNPDDNFVLSDEFDMKIEINDESSDSDSDSDSNSNSDTDSNIDSNSDHNGNRQRNPPADPVYYAVKLNLPDVAVKMIEGGEPYEQPGREGNVLQLALYDEHWKVAKALLCSRDNLESLITQEAGPHGTPLYIASAKAEDTVGGTIVETLIRKGAQADGPKDGKYGSALHVAAYAGRGETVRLLLEEGEADVNQEGGMFGTALHAAAAEGHASVVEILLEHEADPAIVSGIFGTPLQASLASSHPDERTLELLDRAIEKQLAHSVGSESASNGSIGWLPVVNRLRYSNRRLFRSYGSLFTMPASKDKDFQMPEEFDLNPQQEILAGTLERWHLPGGDKLRQLRRNLAKRHPHHDLVREQLADIQRTLPIIMDSSYVNELNRRDFRGKALFWSGINYILESLKPLILDAVKSMEIAVVGTKGSTGRDYFDFRRTPLASSSLRRHLSGYKSRQRFWPRFLRLEIDMELNDRLALEMSQQQQLLFQKQLSCKSPGKPRPRGDDDASVLDNDSDDNESVQGEDNTEIHLVVDTLLPLVKDIVDFGKQCDQLHCIAAQRSKDDLSDLAAETIGNLTYENFTAVMRLATSVEQWHRSRSRRNETSSSRSTSRSSRSSKSSGTRSTGSSRSSSRNSWSSNSNDGGTHTRLLAQTVRLLRNVRLPRIAKLAAAASQELPDTVRKEVVPAPEHSQDQLYEQMRDLIRETVRETVQETVREAVRDEMERQQERGWGKYLWRGT